MTPRLDIAPAALAAALDRLLPRVEKPTRYLGGEWNQVVKPDTEVFCRVALAFPDVYEIGMSHLGFRILYALLNGLPGVQAERAFMPWTDMLALLAADRLPLTTLETRRPLAACDVVGFSMQHELTASNVLAMLDAGGIPPLAAERHEGDPLVLAGGPAVFNPEPVADFFDLILAGDGEEALVELLDLVRAMKRSGASRLDIIRAAAKIPGWYAPGLYDAEPEPRLGLLIPRPRAGEDVPSRVTRRVVYDLDRYPFPAAIVVPHGEIVHDRISWEIMRGCPVGCRFCQAGYVYRPTRERDPAAVRDGVAASVAATGYDEFSLTSLNTGEYGAIVPLLTGLMDTMEPRRVSAGLSSLHATTLSEGLVAQVKRVRKAGFTIAPEAGSQRMRDVINKNLTEHDILRATRLSFEAGWQLLKLYFMIGLPAECDDDVDAIADLAGRIARQGREIGGSRVKVTLSASTFVPKVFTPFQWFGMDSEEAFRAKQDRIRRRVPRGVDFKHHARTESWLEGVLSRGDRRMGAAIHTAWKNGALLDSWSEHIKPDVWRAAFEAHGIDPDAWATRPIPLDAELPWEVIDPLVRRGWLESEYRKSLEAATMATCVDACSGCAPFSKECVRGAVAEARWVDLGVRKGKRLPAFHVDKAPAGRGLVQAAVCPVAEAPAAPAGTEPEAKPELPLYHWRARFTKAGRARFLGHLDLVRALTMGLRRAEVDVAYTQGFKPHPKIAFSPALGLGIASRAEYVDFATHVPLDDEAFLAAVNGAMPEGVVFDALVPADAQAAALQEAIVLARYRAELPQADPALLAAQVATFAAASAWPVERVRKGKQKTIDIRPLVPEVALDGPRAVAFALRLDPQGSARVPELLEALAGPAAADAAVERLEQLAAGDGRMLSPLVAARATRRGVRALS